MKYLDTFKKLKSDAQGIAYLEFFLAFPILLLLLIGAVDLTRMVLIHQKLDRVAFTLADVVTQQGTNVSNACPLLEEMDGAVVRDIIRPFDFENRFDLRVTSIINRDESGNVNNARPTVEWVYTPQRELTNEFAGFVTTEQVSGGSSWGSLVNLGNNPDIEALSFAGLERVIVAETFYNFTSLFPGLDLVMNQVSVEGTTNMSGVNFSKRIIMRARNTNPRDDNLNHGTISTCNR